MKAEETFAVVVCVLFTLTGCEKAEKASLQTKATQDTKTQQPANPLPEPSQCD